MSLKAAIVVEGNKKIGLGHAYRCRTLARTLKRYGFKVCFFTKSPAIQHLLNNCFLKKNISSIVRGLKNGFDVVIVDMLQPPVPLLKQAKTVCKLLICIDNTHSSAFYADICIGMLYKNRLPKPHWSTTRFYNGPKYIILGHVIRNPKKNHPKNAKNILVIQGGSDTYNFVPQLIKTLKSCGNDLRITAILGLGSRRIQYKNVRILNNVKNMASVMRNADLALTAGGITSLELASMGIPSIIIYAEPFEAETARMLARTDAAENLGYYKKVRRNDIIKSVSSLRKKRHKRMMMSWHGVHLVDGRGAERIASIIRERVR